MPLAGAAAIAFWLALSSLAFAAIPTNFVSRGPGGGGSFFDPSMSPFVPGEIWVTSDMGEMFTSSDFGGSWQTVDFRRQQGGNQVGHMQFTSDPLVRYGLNGALPVRSKDGGISWTNVAPDPWDGYYFLSADPHSTNRLLVSDYSTLLISTNGGATYSQCFTTNDFLIAGAFWDGTNIYVGTRVGLVISTNGGASFRLAGMPGIGANEQIVSFAGAKQSGALRFFCVTYSEAWPGIEGAEYVKYQKLYRLDGGTGSWVVVTNGVGAGDPFYVAMTPTNTSIAYAAGSDGSAQPLVLKTVNGGNSWTSVMQCSGNANVATGWSGDDSGPWNWKKWSYGECAMGFAVSPIDPNRVIITDLGFMHVTTNGGATWQQAYDWVGCQNPVGSATPKTSFYTGNGAEDTSCWWLSWFSTNTLFCCFTDQRGMLSTNGGVAWMSPLSLTFNSTYQTVKHPTNGLVYAAVSLVHDMYAWDQYCKDASIDGGSGAVLYSTNLGTTWAQLSTPGNGKPVVALAVDPQNLNRLYAAVVNRTNGGIYRTANLQAGTSATWTKLAVPPRTEGHPYNIYVLNDGTLVATYCARIATNDFQPSSGVFVSTTDGASWVDRTATGMRYYTKDLTIDPSDPAQNTWYAGVWGEWGSSSGLGGLYVTRNRGVSWTLLTTNIQSVGSCAINPANTNELYVATETQGLWYCTNRNAATPTFAQSPAYPFSFPTRVFFNPYNTNEIWVTSYGNGMRLGWSSAPSPILSQLQKTNATASLSVTAAAGQTVVLSASLDLKSWTPVATNLMFINQAGFSAPASTPTRFFRAQAN